MASIAPNAGEEVEQQAVNLTISQTAEQLAAVNSSITKSRSTTEASSTEAGANAITTKMANLIATHFHLADVRNGLLDRDMPPEPVDPDLMSKADVRAIAAQLAGFDGFHVYNMRDALVDFGWITTEMGGRVRTPANLTASGRVTAEMIRDAMLGVDIQPATAASATAEPFIAEPAAPLAGAVADSAAPITSPVAGQAAAAGVLTGRVIKRKSTTTPTKRAKANTAGISPAQTTPRLLIGKASGPTCLKCRKNKARCDRVVTCEKCAKAGVVCENTSTAKNSNNVDNEGLATGSGGPRILKGPLKLKACDRCKKMKAACVRKDKCVRCDKRGEECVIG